MDSHADTGVAGANLYPLAFTGEVCDVSPLSETYKATKNIPIETCATVVTETDTGKEYLLVFHQMLWFGSNMSISLIQPNQCLAFGVEICDDPTDLSSILGMQLSEDFLLPFQAKGPMILLTSRCPTGEEIGRLPHFVVTEDDWDPSSPIFDKFGQYTEEREYKRLVYLLRTVNDVSEGNRVPDLPEKNYEYDTAMDQISPRTYTNRSFIRSILVAVNVASHVGDDVHGEMSENLSNILAVVGEKRSQGKHDSESIS